MDIWKIESNPVKQTILTWAIVIVGLILAYGFRNYDGSYLSNSLSGFLLGILLLLVGVPGVFMIVKQTITIDRNSRQIVIEDVSRFKQKNQIIYFDEIDEVYVSRLGNRSEGSISYYVTLKLKSGNNYPLFFPAYYDRRWNKSIAESRCNQLKEFLVH